MDKVNAVLDKSVYGMLVSNKVLDFQLQEMHSPTKVYSRLVSMKMDRCMQIVCLFSITRFFIILGLFFSFKKRAFPSEEPTPAALVANIYFPGFIMLLSKFTQKIYSKKMLNFILLNFLFFSSQLCETIFIHDLHFTQYILI